MENLIELVLVNLTFVVLFSFDFLSKKFHCYHFVLLVQIKKNSLVDIFESFDISDYQDFVFSFFKSSLSFLLKEGDSAAFLTCSFKLLFSAV
jgi:hypothetical protein